MSRVSFRWRDTYKVITPGPRCLLAKGEIVTVGQRWETELMTGDLLAQEFVRASGERVILRPRDGLGAILRKVP